MLTLDYQPVAAEVRPFNLEGCAMFKWRTGDDGIIYVSRDGGPEFIPTLKPDKAEAMERVLTRWGALSCTVAERWNIPPRWINAMIKRESNGNPGAINHEPNGWTGIGLLQITHPALKGGLTDAQLYDPETNLNIGARFIARQLVPKYGQDFPKIAAAYNAGSVRKSGDNEWAMVCTGSHIEEEVEAVNYQVLRVRDAVAEALAHQFDLVSFLDLTGHGEAHDTEPAPPPDFEGTTA